MQPLISVTEASSLIAKHQVTLGSETVALEDALGRTLASDILADRDAPPFDRVMMDGIAINTYNHVLGSWRYKIMGTQAAGEQKMVLPRGEFAIEVMTGATLPTDANAIIPVEKYDIAEDYALPHDGLELDDFHHVHRQGSDGKTGDILLKSGTILTPNELAIAASAGAIQLEVSRLPRIQLITTGDEVIDPSETPTDYQIRRSHPTAITALIKSQNLGIVTSEHLPDNPELIESKLSSVLADPNIDILILTGGISMGKFDWVAPLLQKLLGSPVFHGVAQRPGKPFAFWKSPSEKLIFALPGNPVSVMATMHRYVLPTLRKITGNQETTKHLPLAEEFNWELPLTGILPYNSNNGKMTIHPPRNSGDYISLHGTEGFTEIPPNSILKAGVDLPLY